MISPSRFDFASRGCLCVTRGRDFSARGGRSRAREIFSPWVRFRALVKQIKAHANYNTAIGEALGIEGEEQSGPDLMTLQPEIKVMVAGSEVKVFWSWQGQRAFLDAIEIEVDRGTGWQMLTIYRVGDQRVGQWSNEVGLNVGG